ncbi:hypothetical protein WNZ15_22435 [Roseibium sp. AS2]|uniref:hypothetical protein n=1 Tax=Roseibium sp. AS2 TaxID=3135781 RepID=UPI00317F9174
MKFSHAVIAIALLLVPNMAIAQETNAGLSKKFLLGTWVAMSTNRQHERVRTTVTFDEDHFTEERVNIGYAHEIQRIVESDSAGTWSIGTAGTSLSILFTKNRAQPMLVGTSQEWQINVIDPGRIRIGRGIFQRQR